jgi:hypothetical protein
MLAEWCRWTYCFEGIAPSGTSFNVFGAAPGADGLLYASYGGFLVVVNATNGNLMWYVMLWNQSSSEWPPMLLDDGLILIHVSCLYRCSRLRNAHTPKPQGNYGSMLLVLATPTPSLSPSRSPAPSSSARPTQSPSPSSTSGAGATTAGSLPVWATGTISAGAGILLFSGAAIGLILRRRSGCQRLRPPTGLAGKPRFVELVEIGADAYTVTHAVPGLVGRLENQAHLPLNVLTAQKPCADLDRDSGSIRIEP